MERPEDESRVRETVWGPPGPLTAADLIDLSADILERQGWRQFQMFDYPTTKEGWRKLFDDFDWYPFNEYGHEAGAGGIHRTALSACIYMRPEGFAECAVCASGALNMAAYGVPYQPMYGELPHYMELRLALVLLEETLGGFAITEWNDLPQQTAEKVVKQLRKVAADNRKETDGAL